MYNIFTRIINCICKKINKYRNPDPYTYSLLREDTTSFKRDIFLNSNKLTVDQLTLSELLDKSSANDNK